MQTALNMIDQVAPFRGHGAPGKSDDVALVERQLSFQAALGRAGTESKSAPPEKLARDAAEQLITQTLILPLLKQLRSTNQSAAPFTPSAGEQQFGALGDAQLAQRITRASHFPLVDRLAQDLLMRAGADRLGRAVDSEIAPRSLTPTTMPQTGTIRSTMWQD